MTEPNLIDLDLVDEVVSRIPGWTWSIVRDSLVSNLVDAMPGDYYNSTERNHDLIVDAFKILGDETTLYILDALQLDKVAEPQDNAPCSIDPG